MVNLELYKVFHTVAKSGSLTKAAQELYISQPAVSQAIKQLENQLGTSLFNRTHRGMELSVAGKMIFKQVADALALLDDAENKVMELNTVATGTIRIGATDSIFTHVLADKLAEYNAKYPSVKLELISSTSPYTIGQLKQGLCDVAFVNLPLVDDEVRFCGTITHLSDVFIAGKRFENLKNKEIPLKSLQELPLIMVEENTVFRRELAKYTQSLGIRLHPDIEVANWNVLLKLVVKGLGVGCIPREYCLAEIANGEVFELNTSPALPVRGVGVATQKNVPLNFALKEFIATFNLK